eukprot:361092-Chlamydomonas_euryale.AAC.2
MAGWLAGWMDGQMAGWLAGRLAGWMVFEFSRVLCKPGCMQTIERTRMDTLYEHCMNMGMRASAWEQTCQGSRGRGGTLCEAAAGGPI